MSVQAETKFAKQQRLGTVVVCRILHARATGLIPWKSGKVAQDIEWLQLKLANWKDDGSKYGGLVKQQIYAVMAECQAKANELEKKA